MDECSRLEAEITSLKMKLEKQVLSPSFAKFEKATETLNEILAYQRDPHITFGLGFDAGESSKKNDLKATKENSAQKETMKAIKKEQVHNLRQMGKNQQQRKKPIDNHRNIEYDDLDNKRNMHKRSCERC